MLLRNDLVIFKVQLFPILVFQIGPDLSDWTRSSELFLYGSAQIYAERKPTNEKSAFFSFVIVAKLLQFFIQVTLSSLNQSDTVSFTSAISDQ